MGSVLTAYSFDGTVCQSCNFEQKFITVRYRGCRVFCFLGELVSKRPSDSLDGAPFVVGIVTLLKQFHSDNTDQFFALLSQYIRSLITSTQG